MKNSPLQFISDEYGSVDISLKGKRFLITQNSLKEVAGSEVFTLEFASYLQDAGASVTVYTYCFADPMKRLFGENDIYVVDNDDVILSLAYYDYIWVNHQTLPLSIIRELKYIGTADSLPKFIFYHMSSLDYVIFERSFIWNLENTLSSLSAYVSCEARDVMMANHPIEVRSALFQNFAPVAFSTIRSRGNASVQNVLILSSHIPASISDVRKSLINRGINVVSMGNGEERYELISPQYLAKFDVVITIGKTVQYCLVSGIPVYVYDRFGGPGYLNDSNFDDAEYANFSGRGFTQRSPELIEEELLQGYSDAVEYYRTNREVFREKYRIGANISRLLIMAEDRAIHDFSPPYVQYLIDSHTLTRDLIAVSNKIVAEEAMIDSIRTESAVFREEFHRLLSQYKEIASLKNHLRRYARKKAPGFLIKGMKRFRSGKTEDD
jgi:hypothetical protein